MYILGHIGPTVNAARALGDDVDLRLAALLSLGPDIIDKPLVFLFPTLFNGNTRGLGHTLLVAFMVLAVLTALRRRLKRPLLLWGCYLGHGLLDFMWLHHNPQILFWPLLGPLPPPMNEHLSIVYLWGEAIGLGMLLFLAWRHRSLGSGGLVSILKTGRFSPS